MASEEPKLSRRSRKRIKEVKRKARPGNDDLFQSFSALLHFIVFQNFRHLGMSCDMRKTSNDSLPSRTTSRESMHQTSTAKNLLTATRNITSR